MDFIVHAQMMFHHKAFGLLLIAPCRFAHIRPEAGDAVINRLLLICSPPVGYGGQGKVHYSAVASPGPGHVVTLAVGTVFHKVTQTVGFFPLLLVGL